MGFEVVEQLTQEQIEDLHRLYQLEWWTQGRQLKDIRRMLQHSNVVVAFCDVESKRLVAFARVLTDYVYKALILDVIVAVSHRSEGLGRALIDAIMSHPSLQSLQHFELYCLPEMAPFYERWGFTKDLGELCFMRLEKSTVETKFVQAESQDDLDHIRKLFQEYADALGFDLSFQDFKKELAELPGEYAPPDGCMLLAYSQGQIAGCVAVRKMSEDICEMKRLYVRPEFRGKRIGKELGMAIIKKARQIGYARMRLDTVPSMKEAIPLYRSLGFEKIEPYRYNPIQGAMFMELTMV